MAYVSLPPPAHCKMWTAPDLPDRVAEKIKRDGPLKHLAQCLLRGQCSVIVNHGCKYAIKEIMLGAAGKNLSEILVLY